MYGTKVPPKLNGVALDEQAARYGRRMRDLLNIEQVQAAKEKTARQRAAANSNVNGEQDGASKLQKRRQREVEEAQETPTVKLWTKVENMLVYKESVAEFVALAQLVFVMVPGSVEDERRFSAMNFIQSKVRNRLDEHLGLCVRMFTQDLFDLRSFPFKSALKNWKKASPKGRYCLNR